MSHLKMEVHEPGLLYPPRKTVCPQVNLKRYAGSVKVSGVTSKQDSINKSAWKDNRKSRKMDRQVVHDADTQQSCVQALTNLIRSQVVPWLRRLVASFSLRRSGSVQVGFVMDKVELGQVLRFSPVNIIPQLLSTLIYHLWDEQLVATVQRHNFTPST
jgi:hypothetical protein